LFTKPKTSSGSPAYERHAHEVMLHRRDIPCVPAHRHLLHPIFAELLADVGKNSAKVEPSDVVSRVFPSNHGFTAETKSQRPSHLLILSFTRLASVAEESFRKERAKSVTRADLPVKILPKSVSIASRAHLPKLGKIPARKSF
jgi:hypothetical protein